MEETDFFLSFYFFRYKSLSSCIRERRHRFHICGVYLASMPLFSSFLAQTKQSFSIHIHAVQLESLLSKLVSSVPPIVPTSAPRGHSNKHGKRGGAGGGKGRGTSLFLSPGAHDGRSSFARSSNMSPFCPSRENVGSAAGALASPSGMDGNLDPNGNDANGPCPLPFPCPSASCNRTFATYSSMFVQFPPPFPGTFLSILRFFC